MPPVSSETAVEVDKKFEPISFDTKFKEDFIDPQHDGIVMLSPGDVFFNDAKPRPDGKVIYHIFEQLLNEDICETECLTDNDKFDGKKNELFSKASRNNIKNIQEILEKNGISFDEWCPPITHIPHSIKHPTEISSQVIKKKEVKDETQIKPSEREGNNEKQKASSKLFSLKVKNQNNTMDAQYSCRYCSFSTVYKSNLFRHIVHKHKKQWVSNRPVNRKTRICSRKKHQQPNKAKLSVSRHQHPFSKEKNNRKIEQCENVLESIPKKSVISTSKPDKNMSKTNEKSDSNKATCKSNNARNPDEEKSLPSAENSLSSSKSMTAANNDKSGKKRPLSSKENNQPNKKVKQSTNKKQNINDRKSDSTTAKIPNEKIIPKSNTVPFIAHKFKKKLCDIKTEVNVTTKESKDDQENIKFNIFKCTECSYVCKEQQELYNHKLFHLKSKLYKCRSCGYATNNQLCLERHRNLNHPKSEKQLLNLLKNKKYTAINTLPSNIAHVKDSIIKTTSISYSNNYEENKICSKKIDKQNDCKKNVITDSKRVDDKRIDCEKNVITDSKRVDDKATDCKREEGKFDTVNFVGMQISKGKALQVQQLKFTTPKLGIKSSCKQVEDEDSLLTSKIHQQEAVSCTLVVDAWEQSSNSYKDVHKISDLTDEEQKVAKATFLEGKNIADDSMFGDSPTNSDSTDGEHQCELFNEESQITDSESVTYKDNQKTDNDSKSCKAYQIAESDSGTYTDHQITVSDSETCKDHQITNIDSLQTYKDQITVSDSLTYTDHQITVNDSETCKDDQIIKTDASQAYKDQITVSDSETCKDHQSTNTDSQTYKDHVTVNDSETCKDHQIAKTDSQTYKDHVTVNDSETCKDHQITNTDSQTYKDRLITNTKTDEHQKQTSPEAKIDFSLTQLCTDSHSEMKSDDKVETKNEKENGLVEIIQISSESENESDSEIEILHVKVTKNNINHNSNLTTSSFKQNLRVSDNSRKLCSVGKSCLGSEPIFDNQGSKDNELDPLRILKRDLKSKKKLNKKEHGMSIYGSKIKRINKIRRLRRPVQKKNFSGDSVLTRLRNGRITRQATSRFQSSARRDAWNCHSQAKNKKTYNFRCANIKRERIVDELHDFDSEISSDSKVENKVSQSKDEIQHNLKLRDCDVKIPRIDYVSPNKLNQELTTYPSLNHSGLKNKDQTENGSNKQPHFMSDKERQVIKDISTTKVEVRLTKCDSFCSRVSGEKWFNLKPIKVRSEEKRDANLTNTGDKSYLKPIKIKSEETNNADLTLHKNRPQIYANVINNFNLSNVEIRLIKCDSIISKLKEAKLEPDYISDKENEINSQCNNSANKTEMKIKMENTNSTKDTCSISPVLTDSKKKIRKRKAKNVTRETNFTCEQCAFSTSYLSSYKRHIKGKHTMKPVVYECIKCPYTTEFLLCMNLHSQKHSKQFSKPQTQTSPKRILSPEMKRKLRQFRSSKQFKLKCTRCSFCTTDEEMFEDHKDEHSFKKVYYRCSKCSYRTSSKKSYKAHILSHQKKEKPKEQRVYNCSQCTFTCKNINNSSNRRNEQQYTCDQCGYQAETEYLLAQHDLIHWKKKTMKCAHCSYETNYRGNLVKHVLIHVDEYIIN